MNRESLENVSTSNMPFGAPNVSTTPVTKPEFSFGVPNPNKATVGASLPIPNFSFGKGNTDTTKSFSFGAPTPTTASDRSSPFGVTTTRSQFGAIPKTTAPNGTASPVFDPPILTTKASNTAPVFGAGPTASNTTTTASNSAPLSFGAGARANSSTFTPKTKFGALLYGAAPTGTTASNTPGNTTTVATTSPAANAGTSNVPPNAGTSQAPTPTWPFNTTVTTTAWNAFHTLTTTTTPQSVFTASVQNNTTGLSWPLKPDMFRHGAPSASSQYQVNKSIEELRLEDYSEGRGRELNETNSSANEFPTDTSDIFVRRPESLDTSVVGISQAELMKDIEKQFDRLMQSTETRFNEAYSQQIDHYLTLRQMSELLMKIDKRLDRTEADSQHNNSNFEEIRKRLAACESKLAASETKIASYEVKMSSQESEIKKYKDKIERLEIELAKMKPML